MGLGETFDLAGIHRELASEYGISTTLAELVRIAELGIAVPDLSGRYHARDIGRFADLLSGRPGDFDLIER